MSRLTAVALLLAGTCAVSTCASDAAPSQRDERPGAGPGGGPATVVRTSDPTGDVLLTSPSVPTTAPAEPEYAQVDLTRLVMQRRSSGLRLVYSLAGPVGVKGYRTELVFRVHTGLRKGQVRTLDVYAYLWPKGAYAVAGYTYGPRQDCPSEVSIDGRTVRVDVPTSCLPESLRGRVFASTGLYTDSEDSESRLADDIIRFKGRPGLPAAP